MAIGTYVSDDSMPYGKFGVGLAFYADRKDFGNIKEEKVVKLVNATAKSVMATHIVAKNAECDEMAADGDIEGFKVTASRISAGGNVNGDSLTVSNQISAGDKIDLVATKMQKVVAGYLHAGSVTAGGDILVRRDCSLGRVASVNGIVRIFNSEALSVSAAAGVILSKAVILDTLSTEGVVEMWDSEVNATLSCRATYLKIVNSSLNILKMRLPVGEESKNAEQRVALVNSLVKEVVFEGRGEIVYAPFPRGKSQTPFPGDVQGFV